MPKLGVNIDHVATLRQARREFDPDPIAAARCCERAGAEGIVAHLREDRRHIQEKDIRALRKIVATRLNLEMSLDERILAIACSVRPDVATIVPEKRAEITTELSRARMGLFPDSLSAGSVAETRLPQTI